MTGLNKDLSGLYKSSISHEYSSQCVTKVDMSVGLRGAAVLFLLFLDRKVSCDARNAKAHKVGEWLRIIVRLNSLKSCLRVF